MPDNYFAIRTAMEDVPSPINLKWGRLIRAACRAIDAYDWAQLRRIGEEALELNPCNQWRERIERLLIDPVFRDSVSG